MLENISKLGKSLEKKEQKSINGGFGSGCGILMCTPYTNNCTCYDAPTPTGVGVCIDGMCCD